ncbi:MAG TPA: acyloxyacyl hydrolase [Verrucomicrobiae bacterium]|nr:acyloxyacyl hydrolase [Verrucomicrobiae bacterium]
MRRSALIFLLFAVCTTASAQDRLGSATAPSDSEGSGAWTAPADFSSNSAPDIAATESASTGSLAAIGAPGDNSDGDYVHETLKRGRWQLGLVGGGGDGLGKSDNTQYMYAGGRVGIVLTGEHLPGWLRGDFEWAGDVLPIFTVFPPNSAVYGGSIRPVIWQWNFTSRKKVAPYFAAQGGIIFTRENVPPGDTSQVNFSSGAAFGANIFTKRRRALLVEMSILHISNASLGNHNPGYNGSIFFTVGYSWFRGGR